MSDHDNFKVSHIVQLIRNITFITYIITVKFVLTNAHFFHLYLRPLNGPTWTECLSAFHIIIITLITLIITILHTSSVPLWMLNMSALHPGTAWRPLHAWAPPAGFLTVLGVEMVWRLLFGLEKEMENSHQNHSQPTGGIVRSLLRMWRFLPTGSLFIF